MAAFSSRFSFVDLQNPLFLHPSDGPTSIPVSKLQGAADYRSWRRSMEIQLSSKRKLGFVLGTTIRSTTDATDSIQWDTCNIMVISWIHNNVSDNIKQSIMYLDSASMIWTQLEKRFLQTNGSRKYKLSKDLYSMKQDGTTISKYYTAMSGLWEEIESMNCLPVVTNMTAEITALLNAIGVQREELKLFQFLNGLDEHYSSQRSQLLMMCPLPSVESACAVIQQEESQRDLLKISSPDMSALYSKVNTGDRGFICNVCGKKGHSADKCWKVVGLPKWHSKYKKQTGVKLPGADSVTSSNTSSGFIKTAGGTYKKSANNVQGVYEDNTSSEVLFTHQQLEQILKLLPTQVVSSLQNPKEDLDSPFLEWQEHRLFLKHWPGLLTLGLLTT